MEIVNGQRALVRRCWTAAGWLLLIAMTAVSTTLYCRDRQPHMRSADGGYVPSQRQMESLRLGFTNYRHTTLVREQSAATVLDDAVDEARREGWAVERVDDQHYRGTLKILGITVKDGISHVELDMTVNRGTLTVTIQEGRVTRVDVPRYPHFDYKQLWYVAILIL